MTEIQGKSSLVRVSERFELARVRVIGSRLYCCSFSWVRINILKQLWCYNLLQSCYRQDVAKIIFSLFSRNKNLAKLRVHFKLQVGNPRTKLTETWPTYDQIVIRKSPFCQFWLLLSFFSYSNFSTGNAYYLLFRHLLITKEQTYLPKKSEPRFSVRQVKKRMRS